MGSLSLLQGIFPTQGSNPGLLHCRWTLYQLSHQGSKSPLKGWNEIPWPSFILKNMCLYIFTDYSVLGTAGKVIYPCHHGINNLFKNWSIVDLQCCVNFCCIASWLSYIYIYMLIHIYVTQFYIYIYTYIYMSLCIYICIYNFPHPPLLYSLYISVLYILQAPTSSLPYRNKSVLYVWVHFFFADKFTFLVF